MTKAHLKESGKVPEESDRFTMVVMGPRRAWRHFLRRKVGMRSRGQVESEEARMASETSEAEAGGKAESGGGGRGVGLGEGPCRWRNAGRKL